MHVLTCRRS